MVKFSGLGRFASVTVIAGTLFTGLSAQAQEIPAEHVQAARAAITALGATDRLDNILPNISDRLKTQLIQAYPNLEDKISQTVDAEALKLAPRRGDLEREAALVYAKAFTVEELNAMTAFYSSEAGKKLLKDGPIAMRELMKAADIWTAGVARDLEKQANEAMLKEVGATPPAPKP
ncbi:MAG: DUF2059 domain-containing protein [Alphaproteobacteria bacterium]|nr:DUF2059 domain-containing protein [Rhizobiaceae bacterium]MBC7150138.1 DUF2059 domain-containing protein [Rhizobium sp.]MBU3960710.1 DUF2059 domain-containing protein [Alphaproteobacteria bacterium]MBU4049784.1 DUF2059 domain-containing protein [Alphaproteobacteria bacterium]MBU4090450.1 DUF2059 domain-containing protein [Alphaproteobacteria bacterium]